MALKRRERARCETHRGGVLEPMRNELPTADNRHGKVNRSDRLPHYVDEVAGTVVLDDDGLDVPEPFVAGEYLRVSIPTLSLEGDPERVVELLADLAPDRLAGPDDAPVENPDLAPDLLELAAPGEGLAVYRIDDQRDPSPGVPVSSFAGP